MVLILALLTGSCLNMYRALCTDVWGNTYNENATCCFLIVNSTWLGLVKINEVKPEKQRNQRNCEMRHPANTTESQVEKWKGRDRNAPSESSPSPKEEKKSIFQAIYHTHRKEREDSRFAWSLWEITNRPFSWAHSLIITLKYIKRTVTWSTFWSRICVICVHLTMEASKKPKWWLV